MELRDDCDDIRSVLYGACSCEHKGFCGACIAKGGLNRLEDLIDHFEALLKPFIPTKLI